MPGNSSREELHPSKAAVVQGTLVVVQGILAVVQGILAVALGTLAVVVEVVDKPFYFISRYKNY